jgi:hypothetical protein
VHWQQPPGESVDGYVLSLGTQSGVYDPRREIEFSAASAQTDADGTHRYEITLDRSRDQFLMLRAYNPAGISAPSNELRVPALGAASMMSATAAALPVQLSAGGGASEESSPVASEPAPATSAAVSAAEASPRDAEESISPSAADEPLRSLDLNGADEYLATTGSGTVITSRSFTLSLWARTGAVGIGRMGLLRLGDAPLASSVEIVLDATGEPALELWREDGNGVRTLVRRAPLPSLGDDWWHLAASVDAGAGRTSLYFDGVLLAIEAGLPTPAPLDASARIGFALGAPGVDSAAWNGRLGHAAFFARALEASEVEAIALGGHLLDLRSASGSDALAHYWRLGADATSVGRDSATPPAHLDDAMGFVDGADIANDAPLARPIGADPSTQ